MNFQQKLKKISKKNNSLLCIGLDSDIKKLPAFLKNSRSPQFEFNRLIIDETHDLVCAYKPNIAFYEALGIEGLKQLKMTIDYIHNNYSEIPTILDCKRADIGNTNQGYVQYFFDHLNSDAVTINPYFGREALIPFLEKKDKGIFVLCRTSNRGAGEFQDLIFHRKPLYQIVAKNVANDWNKNNNCGLVVGATYPEELKIVRHIVGNMPILIPGVGAQGADVKQTVSAGIDSEKLNAIINSSRSIIFASKEKDFEKESRKKALELRNLINSYI